MTEDSSIRDIYQEIGDFFRKQGAERILLVSSKTNHERTECMRLELAVDGCQGQDFQEKLRELWPRLEIHIVDMGAGKISRETLKEIEEDGVKL